MNEVDIEIAGGVTRSQLRRSSYRNPNRLVAGYGDSRVFRGMPTTDTTSAAGWQGFVDALTYCRADFPTALNFGVAGDTSEEATARIGAVLASGAGTVIILVGTNDRPINMTYEESRDNIDQAVDAFLGAGMNVIVIAELPRGSASWPSSGLTAAQQSVHNRLRQHLRGYADRGNNRLIVVDPWPTMADPTSTLGYIRDDLSGDGLHLNEKGNYALAGLLKPALELIYSPRSVQMSSGSDGYDATYFPGGILTVNPRFTGTGGSATSGASGSVADGWNLLGLSGATVAGAKYTGADGRVWQQVTISGTPTGTGVLLYRDRSSAPLAGGDILQASCEVDIVTAGQPYYSVCPFHRVSGTGFTTVTKTALNADVNLGHTNNLTWKGLYRPPNLVVPAGSSYTLRTGVTIQCVANQAADLVVRVTDFDCHKVL